MRHAAQNWGEGEVAQPSEVFSNIGKAGIF